MQKSTPKGSDCWVSASMEPRRWIEQVEDHQSHWKLKRFSSWLKMQSVFQEPNLENKKVQERMTRRIKQLEEEKLFAEMQASKEVDKRRKTPEQKGATSTTILEEENTALKEQVRELKEQVHFTDDVFARAWGGEFGRQLCGMAETRGEKTMSTLSTEEASWIENQVRHSTAGSA